MGLLEPSQPSVLQVTKHRRTTLLVLIGAILCLALLAVFVWNLAFTSISFELRDLGSGRTDDGVRFSFKTYESPDGRAVVVYFESRETTEQAEQRFEHLAKKAVRVIERTPHLDARSHPVGERLVAVFPDGGFTILISEGKKLYTIRADSQRHALEFERQFFTANSATRD